ncbi:MAG: THUMP domain-containing class I SAM-dependent RNA methyltransferase [Candidatus Izemoplasmataceae bacterium]
MKTYQCIATSSFGLEAVVKRELIDLNFEVIETENGKITFLADAAGIARANLWLRSADRVLLKVGEFKATTFDELFDQTTVLPWSDLISKDGNFIINGKSVKSTLSSVRNVQSITEKAIIKNLQSKYRIDYFSKSGDSYPILVSILKDQVTLTLDTSGDGLHKRGYRVETVEAPMKETLAAATIMLSFWEKDRVLYDVFCGSGTIPIEAAMIGRNIAPGLNRDFTSKHWDFIGTKVWKEETKKAYLAIDHDVELNIHASDISEKNLEAAKENAIEAGVDDCINFTVSDYKDVDYQDNYAVLISNPPYGERLSEQDEVRVLYKNMGKLFKKLPTWSIYILTSYDDFEEVYGQKVSRRRKLYNGRIETWFYQYYGPRPPRNE